MTVADGELEVRLGVTLLEECPLTQDEAVSVEFEVRRIIEDDLAHMRFVLLGFFQMHTDPFCDLMDVFVELVKVVLVGEALRLQQ